VRLAALLPLTVVIGLLIAAPAWAPTYSECSDSRDQDGDALVDLDDPDCADPADELEGRLTRTFAAALTRRVVRADFYPATKVSIDCRRLTRFRCQFSLLERSRFPYQGVLMVWAGSADWTAGEVVRFRYSWFRGRCGALAIGVPYAIRVRNMHCVTARRRIGDWYSRGQPLDPYSCSLRSSPATARCEYGRSGFTFKYPE
jgi:hypothetical protein